MSQVQYRLCRWQSGFEEVSSNLKDSVQVWALDCSRALIRDTVTCSVGAGDVVYLGPVNHSCGFDAYKQFILQVDSERKMAVPSSVSTRCPGCSYTFIGPGQVRASTGLIGMYLHISRLGSVIEKLQVAAIGGF